MKKAIRFCGLLVTLTGCGMGSPTAPSDALPHFSYSGSGASLVSPAQVSWAEEEWDRQKACTEWTGNARSTLEVEVFPNWFICGEGSTGVTANGCTLSGRIQVNHKHFEAVLSHELIHFMTQRNGWAPDYAHSSFIWKKCDRLNNG